jgi:probable HAF family extracellular repeat protein
MPIVARIATLLAILPLAAFAAAPGFSVTPIAGKYSTVVDLNDHGRYAVNSHGPDIPIEAASISGGPQNENLGSLGGGITRISAINNKGEAVGASTTSDGAMHSFFYSSGQMQDLGVRYGIGSVNAINDRGDVTGQTGDQRAMVIRDGRVEVIGPPDSSAGGINNAGDVLVEYFPNGQGIRTCIHRHGACEDLPPFGDLSAVASGINDSAWVTGHGADAIGRPHAWLYDGATMTDLTPAATNGAAYDINELGHVVGTIDNRAFLYADGKLIDLNMLADPESGLLLTSAFAINDHEQILANACDRTGTFCATTVLLDAIPAVPEPSSAAMWLSALALSGVLCYTTAPSLKIGRYMATTKPPISTPRITMIIGSISEDNAPTASSTSSS